MNDPVEVCDSNRALVGSRRTEGRFRQFATVYASVRIEDFATKLAYHFVVNRLSRLHQGVGDSIRLHQLRAQRHEHLANDRLPRCNPPG
jgi:hypothetical protein